MEPLKPDMQVNEDVMEKIVMKDSNEGQKNLREDGEIGPQETDHEEEHNQHHAQGIPCQQQ